MVLKQVCSYVVAGLLLTGFAFGVPLQERALAGANEDAARTPMAEVSPASAPVPILVVTDVVYATIAPATVTVTKWIVDDSRTQLSASQKVQNQQPTLQPQQGVGGRLPPKITAHGNGGSSLSQSQFSKTEAPSAFSTDVEAGLSHGLPVSTLTELSASRPIVSHQTMIPWPTSLPTGTIPPSLDPADPMFTALALHSHNVHRANHSNTSPLIYNETLAEFAREKVNTCIWDESLPRSMTGIGMNMAEGTYIGAANITSTIDDMWYNDETGLFPEYGDARLDMSDFQKWGHFTQMIWRATQSVGCWSNACARTDDNPGRIGSGFFTVCTYYPPGNVGGQYAQQVGRPNRQAIMHDN